MAYPHPKSGFFAPIQTAPLTKVNNKKFGYGGGGRVQLQMQNISPVLSNNNPPTLQEQKSMHHVTTVFVGNITEKCSNDLIQDLLKMCGPINSWKRLQDTNGKYQAFGFCEFEHPDGTLRALRILNKFQLGDKKLTVKTDDATSKMLEEFQRKKEKEEKEKLEDQAKSANSFDENGTSAIASESGELLSVSTDTIDDNKMDNEKDNKEDNDIKIIEKINATIHLNNEELIRDAERAAAKSEEVAGGMSRNRRDADSRASVRSSRSHSKHRDTDAKRSRRTRKHSGSSSSWRHLRSSSSQQRLDTIASRGQKSTTPNSGGDASPRQKSRRKRESSGSQSASRSSSTRSSSVASSSGDRRSVSRRHRHSSSGRRHHRHRLIEETDEYEDAEERRRLKAEIKRKEQSYLKRLAKWEDREHRMAKQYERDEESEFERRKMIQREAKKLRQFLEDYDDERDDTKYYKSSSLFQRRRNYERERELDAKDRQEELHEIEELKRQILAQNEHVEDVDAEARRLHEAKDKEKLRSFRTHSGSPTPHRPLGREPAANNNNNNSKSSSNLSETSAVDQDSHDEEDMMDVEEEELEVQQTNVNNRVKEEGDATIASPIPSMSNGSSGTLAPTEKDPVSTTTAITGSGAKLTLVQPKLSSVLTCVNNGASCGIFGDDDDDEEQQAKRKIKPFEITREDRIQAMTPEERKKLIKELIERIPTAKESLFAFEVAWEFVDEALVDRRVRPWINKKICEYIGEEELCLVTFICEKIAARVNPSNILSDLAMVLDDEAEVFMIKLWRLIIYESEAKRLGLNVFPPGSGGSGHNSKHSNSGTALTSASGS